MARRILRYRVIVGAPPWSVDLTGAPMHVESVRLGVGPNAGHAVDFWTEHDDDAEMTSRTFQVFGTGHDLPPGSRHHGSTARTEDGFVWHLYELEGTS